MEPMPTPTGTQAVDRAARLLTEIVDSTAALSFSELASRTGLAKSTTSRLLLALERSQLVRREDSGTYRPGELFVRFAWRSGREAQLAEMASPFLERLGAKTGETVNLGVTHRGVVEQIAQVDSRYVLGTTNWVGRPVPLHASALGKVLLAFGAAELPSGRLERLTDATITNRSALEAELAEVRAQGFAVTADELEPGLAAVAAPVFREGELAVAAMSVSAPTSRLGPREARGVAAACIAEAIGLSRLLGHRSQREGAA
jgi:IclR family acetate operon transcriptional repressor